MLGKHTLKLNIFFSEFNLFSSFHVLLRVIQQKELYKFASPKIAMDDIQRNIFIAILINISLLGRAPATLKEALPDSSSIGLLVRWSIGPSIIPTISWFEHLSFQIVCVSI